ncbi:hypothetical protein OROMI_007734 [Orobanche minor]
MTGVGIDISKSVHCALAFLVELNGANNTYGAIIGAVERTVDSFKLLYGFKDSERMTRQVMDIKLKSLTNPLIWPSKEAVRKLLGQNFIGKDEAKKSYERKIQAVMKDLIINFAYWFVAIIKYNY